MRAYLRIQSALRGAIASPRPHAFSVALSVAALTPPFAATAFAQSAPSANDGATATIAAFEDFSVVDPAGDIGTAASLSPGDEVAGSITVDDQDCYRIFPLNRTLVAVLKPEPFGPLNAALIDRELKVLDQSGETLAEKVEWASDEDIFEVEQTKAARASFLCVAGRFNGWIGDYRLSFDRFAP